MSHDVTVRAALARRGFLAGLGSVTAWAGLPSIASAANTDPRLVVVILRGAVDGLSAVPPIGDKNYAALRGDGAVGAGGAAPLPLDGFFGLHPAMPKLHKLYHAKELLVMHAVATPYRERSHFDGQDVLENGFSTPRGGNTGWLNRAVSSLPSTKMRTGYVGLATSPTVPLIMRGKAPVTTWIPPDLTQATPDTIARLMDLYQHTDPEMAKVFAAGHDIDMLAQGKTPSKDKGIIGAFEQLAAGAGRLLVQEQGPRIAVISYDGWDTHARQSIRLGTQFSALDGAMDALRTNMGAAWRQTVVLVVTEFGRTAHRNGTEGTDHGTATVALLLGGRVRGGRVVSDWPGLEVLHEGRDLAPTTDLRAIEKGVLRDLLGQTDSVLSDTVFPGSSKLAPASDLLT